MWVQTQGSSNNTQGRLAKQINLLYLQWSIIRQGAAHLILQAHIIIAIIIIIICVGVTLGNTQNRQSSIGKLHNKNR